MTPDGTLSGMIGGANRVATPSQVLLPDTRARNRSCSSRVGGLIDGLPEAAGATPNQLARQLTKKIALNPPDIVDQND